MDLNMNRKDTRLLVENWREVLKENKKLATVDSILKIILNLENISKTSGKAVKIIYDLDGAYGRVEYNVFNDVVSGAIDFERVSKGKALGDFFIFETFSVTKGYGPLLYEILVEKATEESACLMSDRGEVSDSAKIVWDKYLKRIDIDYKQIDGDIDSSLSKCYFKIGHLFILDRLRNSEYINFIENN
jgi:hypothetical protein